MNLADSVTSQRWWHGCTCQGLFHTWQTCWKEEGTTRMFSYLQRRILPLSLFVTPDWWRRYPHPISSERLFLFFSFCTNLLIDIPRQVLGDPARIGPGTHPRWFACVQGIGQYLHLKPCCPAIFDGNHHGFICVLYENKRSMEARGAEQRWSLKVYLYKQAQTAQVLNWLLSLETTDLRWKWQTKERTVWHWICSLAGGFSQLTCATVWIYRYCIKRLTKAIGTYDWYMVDSHSLGECPASTHPPMSLCTQVQ